MNDLQRFDNEWKTGDRAKAKAMAKVYVDANRAELAPHLEGCSLEEIVQLVRGYRAAGRENDRIACDMWLLSEYPQQHVTGAINIGPELPLLEAVVQHLKGGG